MSTLAQEAQRIIDGHAALRLTGGAAAASEAYLVAELEALIPHVRPAPPGVCARCAGAKTLDLGAGSTVTCPVCSGDGKARP